MKLDTHVQIREEKFGTVIFETLREKVFVTNRTGADIVRLVQENKSPEEIIDELAARYDTNANAITEDVTAFMDQLVQHQVLV